jgi:t-SNARE complex subunit (syntaxin)
LTAQKHELAIDKFINQKKRYRNASIAKWIMAAITIALIIVIVIVCVNGAGDTIIYK